MIIDDFTLIKSIGKGAFGEVFLTSKKGTNKLFATKKVSRQKATSQTLRKYFINEIQILKEMNHKNIIHFEAIKQTVHNFYIITEYCNGGGLYECLNKYRSLYKKAFSEEIVQYLMRQIVDGIKYIHAKKIMHRDLKLENILVNFDNENDKKNLNMLKATVKIIDFGFATHLGSKNVRYSTLGSPINMDPLLLKKMADKDGFTKSLGYDEKADIWSLGTVCYELLIGQGVFNAQNMNDLVKKVELGTYHIPTNLSKEVVSFLNGMLQYNSKNRLSAEQLSRHHFLTKNIKDFKKIDLNKVSNKVDKQGLNINIKRNHSIWAIFSEEDEKALIDIPGNFYLNDLKPIKEESNENPFKKGNDNKDMKKVDNNNLNNNKIKNDNNLNNNIYKNNNQIKNNNNNIITKNNNNANLNNNYINNNKDFIKTNNNNLKNNNNIKYNNLNINNNNINNNNIQKNINNNINANNNINNNHNHNLKINNQNKNNLKDNNINLNKNNLNNLYNNIPNNNLKLNNNNINPNLKNNNNLNNNNNLYNKVNNIKNNNKIEDKKEKINKDDKTKEKGKEIDYDLLRKQQKYYHELNLKNNKYHRFANYTYNNPYSLGEIINNNNNVNPNNNAIKNGNINNVQNKNIIQNNQILTNQQHPQNQKIKIAQPNFNQNILQQRHYSPILIRNDQKYKGQISNNNNNNDLMNMSKRLPIGSRMPQYNIQHYHLYQQSEQLDTHSKSPIKIKKLGEDEYKKMMVKNLVLEPQNKNNQVKQEKNNKVVPETQNQIENNKYQKTKTYQEIPQNKKELNDMEKPKDNDRNKKRNKEDNSQRNKSPIENKNSNTNKNMNQNQYIYNDNKNQKNKNEHSKSPIQQKVNYKNVTESPLNSKKDYNRVVPSPLNTEKENKIMNQNHLNLEKKQIQKKEEPNEPFNEPFPMPENNEGFSRSSSKNEKKELEPNNNDSLDGLEDLIDFKLGDELCLEPENTEENKSNNINDKDDNNLELPMKKIMEHTVNRPTFGVPPPGSDPNDSYDFGDDFNSGVFQINQRKMFD